MQAENWVSTCSISNRPISISQSQDIDVPLSGLADEIVRLSSSHRRTPVLITPRHLTLRREFVVELSREFLSCVNESHGLRIDWLCNVSLLRQRVARFRSQRINNALLSDPWIGNRASIVVSGSIGRRHTDSTMWVLGLSDERQDLPTWAQKIQLSGLIHHPSVQFS